MDPSRTTQNEQPQQHQDATSSEGKPLSKAADSLRAALNAHSANPGPVMPKDFNVQEEGTKEERRAKAKEMNK